ncbi:hypothetical protein Tco_1470147, partial [Tanacetum coccineum]
VKIHDVPIQVFSKDGISFIASQIVEEALKDCITMGIPLPKGIRFTKEMEKPSKAANVPSSSFSRGFTKNGGLQYHFSESNIHTSNSYDALDDMENDEEVDVVYDETTNLLGNNITRATYTALDASKT